MADVGTPLHLDPKDVIPVMFDGAGSADQQKVAGVSFTPDSNGAASDTYFVEFINFCFSIYDKQGNLKARVNDREFWSRAGIQNPPGVIDPRIVFIPDAGRRGQWLAVQLELGYRVFIATTNPDNPDPSLGNWKASAFDLQGNDFTMLGYDARGVYIGSNCSPDINTPRLTRVAFIPRANALAYPPQLGSIKITERLPKQEYGTSLYPMIDRSGIGWPYETAIGIDNISKKHLTFALFSPQFGEILSVGKIEVPSFEPVSMGFRVKQPRAEDQVLWYDDALVAAPTGDGLNIWVAQTVSRPVWGVLGSLAVRWYRLYIDPMSRQPGLAASGEIFEDHYDHFNPSILSLGKDDYTILSLSRSGDYATPIRPNDAACGNIGAYAAIIRETPSGATTQIVTLRSGQAPNYTTLPGYIQRWGDYSTICPDPTNPRRAWIVNQYVQQGGQGTSQWRDIIASIELPPAA